MNIILYYRKSFSFPKQGIFIAYDIQLDNIKFFSIGTYVHMYEIYVCGGKFEKPFYVIKQIMYLSRRAMWLAQRIHKARNIINHQVRRLVSDFLILSLYYFRINAHCHHKF